MTADPRPHLQSVLEHENLADRQASWHALPGGRTNRVWQVGKGKDALICKLYQPSVDNPVYPNLPGAEYDTLCALYDYDIAPRPIALLHSKVGHLLVYRCLSGSAWSDDTRKVARLLGRLHQIPARFALRRLPTGSAALLAQSRTILSGLEDDLSVPDWLEDLPVVPPHLDLAILHTDVVPGNIIVTNGRPRLIDWQCPALGDPSEDIASFLSPAMQLLYRGQTLSHSERQAFFDTYPGRVVLTRYQKLAPFYHLRIAAYCRWKSSRGEADYDVAGRAEWDAMLYYAKNPDHPPG